MLTCLSCLRSREGTSGSLWKSLTALIRRSQVDLLARRPDDTARRYAEGDPLIREALDHGKLLYERHG